MGLAQPEHLRPQGLGQGTHRRHGPAVPVDLPEKTGYIADQGLPVQEDMDFSHGEGGAVAAGLLVKEPDLHPLCRQGGQGEEGGTEQGEE